MALSLCAVTINSNGEELEKHGTSEFPIACYEEDLSEYTVPWHWHEDLEIILIISGSARVSIDTEEYVVNENEGIFINASILHAVHANSNSKCILKSIVFHPRLIGSIGSIYWQNYLEPIIQNKCLKHIFMKHTNTWHDEILNKSISVWNRLFNGDNGFEIYVRNELSEIIFTILSNHSICESKPNLRSLRNAGRIKTMLQFIQIHFSEEITVATLSREALISESEVLRCFHNTIRTTPNQYLKQYRIQKACRMLVDTDYTSLEIGLECGFQSSSYFTKTFKELMGCTPLEYRKALKI
jgi:AraC-like DNA-binding protein